MQLVGNNTTDLLLYPLATAAGEFLDGALIALGQNDIEITRDLEIGDFTEADYTGYAREAVTWNAPSEADNGETELVGVAGEFRPSGSAVQNSIYTFMLLDSGGALIAAGRFEGAPLAMGDTLDAIVVTPRVRITLGGEGQYVS